MEKISLIIISVFFLISGIDYLKGNQWNMGDKFKEAIMSTGSLILSMAGIFAISPLIGKLVGWILIPIGKLMNIDPSIFPSMFLAVDMGALGISEAIALNMEMYIISGIIIASTLGATVSFSIPLALGLIKDEHHDDFYKGLIFGIITMPIAPIFAAIMLGLDIKTIMINLSPIIILVIIMCLGMYKFRERLVKVFSMIGRGIEKLSLIGLLAIGFTSILGVKSNGLILSLDETLGVIGKIALFLCGAYPMLEFITEKFSNELKKSGEVLKINNYSVSSLLGSLASNIIVFKNFDKLESRGRIICTAFSVSGAFVFGGQMGFVSAQVPDILGIYIISKLLSGILAILLSLIFNRVKEEEIFEIM